MRFVITGKAWEMFIMDLIIAHTIDFKLYYIVCNHYIVWNHTI